MSVRGLTKQDSHQMKAFFSVGAVSRILGCAEADSPPTETPCKGLVGRLVFSREILQQKKQ